MGKKLSGITLWKHQAFSAHFTNSVSVSTPHS